MMYFLESRLTNEVNIMCDVRRNFLEIKKRRVVMSNPNVEFS